MRTINLLISATLVASVATAQQRANSIVFTDAPGRATAHDPMKVSAQRSGRTSNRSLANQRTTGATSRWYNYGDYLGDASAVNFAALYLWNDTTSLDAYSASVGTGTQYLFNDMVSVGMICDPFFDGWSDPSLYSGMMNLTPTNAYTIDSVFISGIYYRNNANTVPVDTLTTTIFYGDGSIPSDLHYKAIDTTGGRSWIYNEYAQDSLFYTNMHYDSVNNRADTFAGGFNPVINKIYLTNTDTSGTFEAVIPVSINVPAGNRPAVSVSFKSGDASFTFGDTVFLSDGTNVRYKYGMFRPLLAFEGVGGVAVFPTNTKDNLNEGEFRDQGADRVVGNLYRPMWFWYDASSGGASDYQYPYFAFHISCPTCSSVGVDKIPEKTLNVIAYPNPANDNVSILFKAANNDPVSLTLTDVMGRNIAVGNIDNSTKGRITVSTAGLPDGIYIYTLMVAGERTAGRFMIRH